jgi:tRNA U34 5-methylaminomethyl-2-thiouridine-forming methyltransferase MnmC
VQQLNYAGANKRLFDQLHQAPWEQPEPITPFFTLQKLQGDLKEWGTTQRFHLIYYDAFAPAAQPELWTVGIFDKIYPLLQPGGILVTYCAKGDVHRAMKAAGFRITKLAGPPGKREMLRAEKAL